MEERWRESDILWGRLDGAERIIKSMVADHPDARLLIGEAQAIIVCETLKDLGVEEKYNLLAESMMRTKEKNADPDGLTTFIRNLKDNAGSDDLRKRLDALIDDRLLRDHYLQNFKTQSQLPPEGTLRSVARATTVIGQILEGLTEKYGAGKKYATFVVRVGRIFWGLVEVSVPRSIPNLLFRHWLFLLYLVEIFLILGGIIFDSGGASNLGWKALGVTLIVDAVVLIINSFMCGKRKKWWRLLLRVLGCLILAAAIAAIGLHLKEDVARLKDFLTHAWQRVF
jgi:hypothetical protein